MAHCKGENNPCYKAYKISTQGYRVFNIADRIKLGRDRRITEHRLIAEGVLGRPLERHEVVHHIDGDKLNNKHSNLLICDVGYHQWLHAEMSYRYQREKFGAR